MKFALRLAVSAAVLAALALFLPWGDVGRAITRMSVVTWLAILAAYLAGHGLNALKWRALVNAGRSGLARVDALRFHYAGLFANMWLPGLVGGDVLRAVLAGRARVRPEAVVLGALADRLIDTLSMAVLLGAGALLVRDALPAANHPGVTWGFVALGLAGMAAIWAAARRPLRRWPARLRRPAGRTLVALRRLRRRPAPALAVFALSLFIQGGFVLLNAWIGHELGIAVPLGAWLLAWSLAKLAALLPISLGGLGVRDATLAALLVPFGVPAALGVVTSLIWQSVLIAGGLLGGLVSLLLGRLPGVLPAHGSPRVSPGGAWTPAPR